MRWIIIVLLCFGVVACSGQPSIDDEKLSTRKLNLEEFFEGELRAYGQFQDRFGTVRQRFTVDMVGTWDGEKLVLVEDFTYHDGREDQRIWTLTKTGDDTWQGTAPDVLGVAEGQESGDAFYWTYQLDLPNGDSSLRVRFEDWMWMLDDQRVLNIAQIKKAGFTLGEVTIFFEKI